MVKVNQSQNDYLAVTRDDVSEVVVALEAVCACIQTSTPIRNGSDVHKDLEACRDVLKELVGRC